MSVSETNNQHRNLAAQDALKLQGIGMMNGGLGMGLTQIEDNQEMFNAGIGLNMNDDHHRFNPLEMSQSLQSNREPRFCFCIPLAKGMCCGLLSLKTILIIISLVDITIGGAAIGIGVIAFNRYQLKMELGAYIFICSVSLLLGFAGLYAVAVKNMKIIKFYFAWKCIEVLVIPVFELIIIFAQIGGNESQLKQSPSINYYIIVLVKAVMRAYFAYLIYSFYKRVDRGELLLVDYGDRKLSKMIEEIKEEQRKQEWELELTERASSRV
eukprot:403342419